MKKPTKKEIELGKKLSPQQMELALEYIKTNNITQSAIKAGYSEKSAHVTGSKVLKMAKVKDYIAAVMERLESDKIADINEVMEFFTSTMRGEVNDQFDLEPALTDRINAGKELMKRLAAVGEDKAPAVTIINNIPKPEDM